MLYTLCFNLLIVLKWTLVVNLNFTLYSLQMVDKRKSSKSPAKSKKPHKRPAHITSTSEQSQVPLPSTTSRVPDPSTTLHVAPSSRTPNVLPNSRTRLVPPTSKTLHGAPTARRSLLATRTSHVAPTSRRTHVSPTPRTSLVSPTARTSATTSSPRTSQVAPLPSSSHVTPPSSIRGVDSPSVSQPPHSEEPSPESSETVAASETQSNVGKITLFLSGKGYMFPIYYIYLLYLHNLFLFIYYILYCSLCRFLPSYPAANGIGEIFKSHFNGPWLSWKKVPSATRDMSFGEFKVCFIPFPFRFYSASTSHTPLSPYSFLFVYRQSFPFVHPMIDGQERTLK